MRPRLPLPLRLYRGGLVALEPVAAAILLWRMRRGKEDRERLGERRGIPGGSARMAASPGCTGRASARRSRSCRWSST